MPNSEVVVITGVSSGIGRVTAEKFVKRGCQVFGTVRSTTKAQAIPGVVLIEMDIRDEASVQHGSRPSSLRPDASMYSSIVRSVVSQAIQKNIRKAPASDGVASTIVDAALDVWKMRRTPKGEASLLAKLRRFMPAGPVGAGIRKTFGLT